MKAIVCRGYGGIADAAVETLEPLPMPPSGVRIAVHAACASFASLLVMQGKHQNRAEPPFTPGTEVAGVVMEVAPGVTLFKPGDRVAAAVRSGGYADEVATSIDTVFHLPDGISFEAGSQFPSVYGTAFAGLAWRARVRDGETVLVHGAAGGSGVAAVQIAKALGARVIASAGSAKKLAAARADGADETLNHRDGALRDQVLALTAGRGVDVVYDPVGGEMFIESLRCMAPEGRLVSVGFAAGSIPEVPANILLVKNLDVIGLYWGHYLNWGRQPAGQLLLDQVRAAFSTMFDWALEGKLAPRTYRSFPLEEFAAALDLISSREVIGRVVFLPRAGQHLSTIRCSHPMG